MHIHIHILIHVHTCLLRLRRLSVVMSTNNISRHSIHDSLVQMRESLLGELELGEGWEGEGDAEDEDGAEYVSSLADDEVEPFTGGAGAGKGGGEGEGDDGKDAGGRGDSKGSGKGNGGGDGNINLNAGMVEEITQK